MTVEPHELLWELPRAEGNDDLPAPADATLKAYRAGTLDAPARAQVEWELAGSRQGRTRLAELAGVRLDARPRRPVRIGYVAAALAAAASLVLMIWIARPPSSPGLPAFDLRVEGLATDRGTAGSARARAGTSVRVTVEARGDAVPNVRFSAYRLEAGTLTRLAEPADVVVDVDRGNARLTAPAERLVGPGPGTRPFFVVVSTRDDLPGEIRIGASDPATALGGFGNVYAVHLTIIESTDGAR